MADNIVTNCNCSHLSKNVPVRQSNIRTAHYELKFVLTRLIEFEAASTGFRFEMKCIAI